MKVFKITEDVFKTEPLFVTDCDFETMRKYLARRFKVSIGDTVTGHLGQMFTFDTVPWRVVWVKQGRRTEVLAHEIFHLVTRICQDKGVAIVSHHPNGDCGDETAAYMLEFFLDRAMKQVTR